MSQWLDDLARTVASPVSRRDALRLLGGSAIAALFGGRLVGRAQAGGGPPCSDTSYPHECGDICCRYDHYCADDTILNGADTHGMCCQAEPVMYQFCTGEGYGWCCPPDATCSTERFACIAPDQCESNQEECGDACCNSDAGEFCCDPDQNLCCSAGVTCCYDAMGNGSCCEPDTTCVPVSATGYPPGRVCCPDERACTGQCCPPGEVCIGNLICCPEASATPERDGCCNPGFVWVNGACCLEGRACGGECCPNGTICVEGECRPCAAGQEMCFEVCCDPGACCLGTCCSPGEVCTGECTVLESQSAEMSRNGGGTLNSSNDAVTLNFMPFTAPEDVTVTYTSHAGALHPLPTGAHLLRSFSLEAENGAGDPVTQFVVPYSLHLAFSENTLAALNVSSVDSLDVMWWNGSSWVSMMPCAGCYASRTDDEVVVLANHFTDFVLVVREHNIHLPYFHG